MKILALSDLHIQWKDSYEIKLAKEIVEKTNPDVVCITGDVFENNIWFDPYEQLSILEKPVICCLGNHEFAYRSVAETMEEYTRMYDPDTYDVHYLDVIGHKVIDGVNFVGNVLWYDGTLKNDPNQSDFEIDNRWLDSKISKFDFRKENEACVKMIKDNYNNKYKNILLTHTVPTIEMNLFSNDIMPNFANMYSGMKNLLTDLKKDNIHFDWSLCGHTHRRTTNIVEETNCVNVGNEYLFYEQNLKYFTFEV